MIELPSLWSLSPIGGMLGMLAVLYWLIASGRLIAKSTHDQQLKAAIERGNEHKDAAELWQGVALKAMGQQDILVESTRATAAVLKAAAPEGVDFDGSFPTAGGEQ